MDSKVFGQFVAKIRKERNMTQAELAGRIGVTDKAVSRWERGLGFPDINTLEPLSNALDISILELMRSEKSVMEKNNNLSESEVTELMANAVAMARENQRQDKASVCLGGIVTLVAAVLVKLTDRANIGGAIFIGAMAALAAVGMYLFARNKEDRDSRKVYGLFMLLGIGIVIGLLRLIGVDSFALVCGLYCILGLVVGIVSGK